MNLAVELNQFMLDRDAIERREEELAAAILAKCRAFQDGQHVTLPMQTFGNVSCFSHHGKSGMILSAEAVISGRSVRIDYRVRLFKRDRTPSVNVTDMCQIVTLEDLQK